MNRLFFLLFCFSFSLSLSSQLLDLKVGEWHLFPSFRNASSITSSDIHYIAGFGNTLGLFDKDDLEMETITSLDGLSKGEITLVYYIEDRKSLVVGFDNGLLNIITGDHISIVSDIKDAPTIKNRKVSCAAYHNNRLFIGGEFGLSLLNFDNLVFEESITDRSVYDIIIIENNLYLASSLGTYELDLIAGSVANKNDFKIITTSESFSLENLANGQLIIGVKDSLWLFDGTTMKNFNTNIGYNATKIKNSPEGLLVIWSLETNNHGNLYLYSSRGEYLGRTNNYCANPLYDFAPYRGLNESLLVGDFVGRSPLDSSYCASMLFGGLYTNLPGKLTLLGNRLAKSSYHYVSANFQPQYHVQGVSIIDPSLNVEYIGVDDSQIVAPMDVCLNHKDSTIFVSSSTNGLYAIHVDGTTSFYDNMNSPLEEVTSGANRVLGMDIDTSGNLWLTQYLKSSLLKFDTKTGLWETYQISTNQNNLVFIDSRNRVWVGARNGLYVLDPETNSSYSFPSNELTSNTVYCLAEDLDGTILAGTTSGINSINCSSNLSNGCQVSVGVQSNNTFLQDAPIYAIEVDGGNNKWVATGAGLLKIDPAVSNILEEYDPSNSPLTDDLILDLEIDRDHGVLYVQSASNVFALGILAQTSTPFHEENLTVFPNPLDLGLDKEAVISGFANRSDITITDINGRVVKRLVSEGRRATWDGLDFDNLPVPTGTYLIFSTYYEEGQRKPDYGAGKITVIAR